MSAIEVWGSGMVATACLGAALLVTGPVTAQTQTAQDGQRCEVREMDPRRGPPQRVFCQGADGRWNATDIPPGQIVAQGPARDTGPLISTSLPPDWRGRITYSGTQEGYVETAAPPMRRLSVDSVVGAMTGGSRRQFGGPYQLQLTIDGDVVSGTYSGGAGMRSGRISGTRNGSQCRLFADDFLIEAECTTERFAGRGQSQSRSRDRQVFEIRASAESVVDAAEQERQRAAAAERAAIERAEAEAEREQAVAAERARIAAMPMATTAQTRMVEQAVRQDSGAWLMNRYDVGSVTNVRVAERSSGTTTLRAEYTYNGGASGWVLARVADGRVECLGYWDMGGCATVRGRGSAAYPWPSARFDQLDRCLNVAVTGAVAGVDDQVRAKWRRIADLVGPAYYTEGFRLGMTEQEILARAQDASTDPDYLSDSGIWAQHVIICEDEGYFPAD